MSAENIISIKIKAEDLEKANAAVKTLAEIFEPHLIALTQQERRQYPKMSDKTEPFVKKSLEYMKTAPQFSPPFIDVNEMEIDFQAITQLLPIYLILERLSSNLDDTILLSGSEAYSAALGYYNSVKQAVKMNVPDAKPIYEDLKKRFERQGPGKAAKSE